MLIRRWRYDDILKISELEKECFPSEPWTFKMLASSFEAENFRGVLAEDGGETIGVACAVMDGLQKIAKDEGVKKLFLEVRVSNYAAMKLYLKCGFRGAYARTRYYPDGEDCLVMVKEI